MKDSKSPEERAALTVAQKHERDAHFSRLFSTSDGMFVLGELNSLFFTNTVGPNQDHAYHMGQKDVMAYILATIQQGKL